jgi:hypothetical protein
MTARAVKYSGPAAETNTTLRPSNLGMYCGYCAVCGLRIRSLSASEFASTDAVQSSNLTALDGCVYRMKTGYAISLQYSITLRFRGLSLVRCPGRRRYRQRISDAIRIEFWGQALLLSALYTIVEGI